MKKNRRKQQRGVALISVLLILVLLIIMGIALMYMADTDTAINNNYRSEQQAFFAAKAGIEEVRDRMRRTAPNSLDAYPPAVSLLPTTVASDSGGVLYVINQGTDPVTVQPWASGSKYKDDEFCHDGYVFSDPQFPNPFSGGVPSDDVRCTNPPNSSSTWYSKPVAAAPAPGWVTSAAPFTGTAGALPYKWVRVTWKQNNSIQGTTTQPYTVDGTATNSSTGATPICWDGTKEVLLQSPATACEQMTPTSMRPVYLVTSLAIAGGSRRMVQAELAKTVMPSIPAAIALDGPNPVFNSYHSSHSGIVGFDASSASPCAPAGDKPAIGVYDNNAVTTVTNALFRPNNYTGNPPGNGPNPPPSVVNIGPTAVAPNAPGSPGNLNQLATVNGLQTLVNTMTQAADNVVPAGGGIPAAGLGTDASPLISVFQGDLSLSGSGTVGAGILLVEGTLSISGSPQFDGMILVIGNGNFQGNGDAAYNGQVLVANINSGVVGQTPGPPTVDFSGGGNSGGTYYDSCKANLGNDRIPYKILATREILY